MSKPEFVYVTYIQSTPEKTLAALIDPEMTERILGPAPEPLGLEDRLARKWRHAELRRRQRRQGGWNRESPKATPPHRLVLTWARR